MSGEYLSMSQASKLCPYEQGYLSLLARRKQLKAVKMGKKWYTTVDWLNDYLQEKKPEKVIAARKPLSSGQKKNKRKEARKIWVVSIFLMVLVLAFLFYRTINKVNILEEQVQKENFVPQEVLRIPDGNGNIEVYEYGTRKVENEKSQEK